MAERRPRVLLAGAPVGELTAHEVGTALARGFADTAQVAVLGLAERGLGLAAVLAGSDAGVETLTSGWVARADDLAACGSLGTAPAPDVLDAGSGALGRLAAYVLQRPAATVAIDLTGTDCHDAGAGLLAALGARADVPLDSGPVPLAGLGAIELGLARDLLTGCDLVGLVPAGERDDLLLGLRGITSRRGRALGVPAERMLAVDAALERFAHAIDPGLAAAPGAGAAGGLGFAVLALGGRLATGPGFTAERTGLDRTVGAADLVVTACDSFDFGSRGGGVVADLARRCEAAETPLVVVSPVLGMSGREMRVMGVESAHPLEPDADLGRSLTATARRLASGWAGRW